MSETATLAPIRVTCRAADSLPIDTLTEFQGRIKRLTPANLERLKRRILRRGINVPVFIWQHNGDNYILDGHQRLKALCALREEGHPLPLIPVDYIEAASKADAKDALLGIASQYGEYVTEELVEFTADLELVEDLRLVDGEVLLRESDLAVIDNSDGEDTRSGRTQPGKGSMVVSIGTLSELVDYETVQRLMALIEERYAERKMKEFCEECLQLLS